MEKGHHNKPMDRPSPEKAHGSAAAGPHHSEFDKWGLKRIQEEIQRVYAGPPPGLAAMRRLEALQAAESRLL